MRRFNCRRGPPPYHGPRANASRLEDSCALKRGLAGRGVDPWPPRLAPLEALPDRGERVERQVATTDEPVGCLNSIALQIERFATLGLRKLSLRSGKCGFAGGTEFWHPTRQRALA